MGRKLAFVLASSNHRTMIVNRLDDRMIDATQGYDVGLRGYKLMRAGINLLAVHSSTSTLGDIKQS
jgi:hypothetical protein